MQTLAKNQHEVATRNRQLEAQLEMEQKVRQQLENQCQVKCSQPWKYSMIRAELHDPVLGPECLLPLSMLLSRNCRVLLPVVGAHSHVKGAFITSLYSCLLEHGQQCMACAFMELNI